jgi:BlaR1 peptidase M56/TonB-dependent Receptor Plug Domain
MHLNIEFMPIVSLFLIKLSVSLAVVWCFYQAVLRRLTFYKLNRCYLLGYTLISFIIPFINIGPMLPDGPEGEPIVIQFIPAIGGVSQGSVIPVSHSAGSSGWVVLLWALTAGALLLLARVVVRWVSLIRLRRKATLIGGFGFKIYQVDGPVTPFSFGNAIFINQHLYTEQEWADIILHEYVHIREKHTIDILLIEMVCILNWYNPFAWLIRYSVRQNLEFIADQQVLEKGVDRKGYQYHLLKVMGEPRYRLANNFNFSSLKKRIVMMNKMRSARLHLVKLLFLLPLVAVLLLAFRDRAGKLLQGHSGDVYVNAAGIVINSPDRKPLEGVLVRDRVTGLQATTDVNGYYKIKIKTDSGTINIMLDYTKPGYDTDFRARMIPALKESIGILDVGLLHLPKALPGISFIAPSFQKLPADPDYSDAEKELHRALKATDDVMRYMQMQKDHPEVSLFYETEDGQKEIIVHTDGTIERYGYPGTPSLDEMNKKYGDMQGHMATCHSTGPRANSGYLARWEGIAEQAQREFHTTNPNVRAIIFPGDSRVIAVPAAGKTRYYDMDNDAENERAEFERLYGKLPDCVPKAGFNSDPMERAVGLPLHRPAGAARDTVPGRGDSLRQMVPVKLSRPDTAGSDQLELIVRLTKYFGGEPLYVVDGKEASSDTLKALNPDRIESVSVLKDSLAINKYGDRGRNGVVFIRTNGGVPKVSLYIVDGREMEADSARRLDPSDIESVNVLKPDAARAKYGEKGRNGVILIKLKHPGGFKATQRGRAEVRAEDKDGRTRLQPIRLRSAI